MFTLQCTLAQSLLFDLAISPFLLCLLAEYGMHYLVMGKDTIPRCPLSRIALTLEMKPRVEIARKSGEKRKDSFAAIFTFLRKNCVFRKLFLIYSRLIFSGASFAFVLNWNKCYRSTFYCPLISCFPTHSNVSDPVNLQLMLFFGV